MIPILVTVLKNVKKGIDKISHHESPKKVDNVKTNTNIATKNTPKSK